MSVSDVHVLDIVKWSDICSLASEIDNLKLEKVSGVGYGRPNMPDCTKEDSTDTIAKAGVSVLMKDLSAPWKLGLPVKKTLYQRFEFAYYDDWTDYLTGECAPERRDEFNGLHVYMLPFYEELANYPVFHTMYLVKSPGSPEAATHEDLFPGSDKTNVKQLVQSPLHLVKEWWHLDDMPERPRTFDPTISAELYYHNMNACPCGGVFRLAFANNISNGNCNGVYHADARKANPHPTDERPYPPYSISVHPDWNTLGEQFTLTEVGWDQLIPEDYQDESLYQPPPVGCCPIVTFPMFGAEGVKSKVGCGCSMFGNEFFDPKYDGAVTPPYYELWDGTYEEYNRRYTELQDMYPHGMPSELSTYEKHSIYETWTTCGGTDPATVRVTTLRFIYTHDRLYFEPPDPEEGEYYDHRRVRIVQVPTAIVLHIVDGTFQAAIRKRWYDMMYYKLRFIIGHHKVDSSSGAYSPEETVGVTWDSSAEKLFRNPSEASMWLAETGWVEDGAPDTVTGPDTPFYNAPYDVSKVITIPGDASGGVPGETLHVATYYYDMSGDDSNITVPSVDYNNNPTSGWFQLDQPAAMSMWMFVDDWGGLVVKGPTGELGEAEYSIDMTPESHPDEVEGTWNAGGGGHLGGAWSKSLEGVSLPPGRYEYEAFQTNCLGYLDNRNLLAFDISVTTFDSSGIVEDSSFTVAVCHKGDCSSPNHNLLDFSLDLSEEIFPMASESFRWGERYMEQFLCIRNAPDPLAPVYCPGTGPYNAQGGFCSRGDVSGGVSESEDCGFLVCDHELTLPWEWGCGNAACGNEGFPVTHAYTFNTLVDIQQFTQQYKVSEIDLSLQTVRPWKFCYRTGEKGYAVAEYKFLPPDREMDGSADYSDASLDCSTVECVGTFYNTVIPVNNCKFYNDQVNDLSQDADESAPVSLIGDTLYVNPVFGRSPIHVEMWKTFLTPKTDHTLRISAHNLRSLLCIPRDNTGRSGGIRDCVSMGYIAGKVFIGPMPDGSIQLATTFMISPMGQDVSLDNCGDSSPPAGFPFDDSGDSTEYTFEIPSLPGTVYGAYRYNIIISLCIDHDGFGMAGGGPYSDYTPGDSGDSSDGCPTWNSLLNYMMEGSPYKTGQAGTLTFTLL